MWNNNEWNENARSEQIHSTLHLQEVCDFGCDDADIRRNSM